MSVESDTMRHYAQIDADGRRERAVDYYTPEAIDELSLEHDTAVAYGECCEGTDLLADLLTGEDDHAGVVALRAHYRDWIAVAMADEVAARAESIRRSQADAAIEYSKEFGHV